LIFKENSTQKITITSQEVLQNGISMEKTRTGMEDVFRRVTSQILGIQGWWRRAEEGERWRRLLRETRAEKEL